LATLGKNLEINFRNSHNEDESLKVDMADGCFVSA
jgi:hypothetical protein